MEKINVGIIGTGNIGTDLIYKINRSKYLKCNIFAGRSLESKGIKIAQELGVPVTYDSIKYIEENPNSCDIVFDATSAVVHQKNAIILDKLGKIVIDLTPAHIGPFCIPSVNGDEIIENARNVNMITCGGQAAAPLAAAMSEVCPNIDYIELVATIASKSAGLGTRDNIDEFTQTTKEALSHFSGVSNTKAIIVLNPAEPPITMRNTVYALTNNPDMDKINIAIKETEKKIQQYVPGYKVVLGPVFDNGKVVVTVEVTGTGDYLPKYSGNLDIITCAAVNVAEKYAYKLLSKRSENV